MTGQIRLNAFDMNCVGHRSPGPWAHPRDRSIAYKDLEYWTDLHRTLEAAKFDGPFIADTDIDGFNLADAGTPETFEDVADHLVPEPRLPAAHPGARSRGLGRVASAAALASE